MNAEASREFKFRIGDGPPERYLEADEEDRRIRRLNRRITWVAFLVPCLAGLLVAAAYIDLKSRVERIDNAGGREMQALAKGLDERLSALAEQQSALVEKQSALAQSLGVKIDLLGQKTDALAVEIKKSEADFTQSLAHSAKATEKAARDLVAPKADRLELDKAVGQLQITIEPLEKRLETVSSEITSLDDNFTRELASVAGTMDGLNRDLSALKEKLAAVSSTDDLASVSGKLDDLKSDLAKLKAQVADGSRSGIDPDYLDARLLKEQRIYQLKLDQTAEEIRRKLSELQKQLSAIKISPSPSRS